MDDEERGQFSTFLHRKSLFLHPLLFQLVVVPILLFLHSIFCPEKIASHPPPSLNVSPIAESSHEFKDAIMTSGIL